MKNGGDQRRQLNIEDNDENDDCSDPDYESKVRICNNSRLSTPMKESTGSNSVPPPAAASAAAAAAGVTTKHHGRHHRLDADKRLRREIANSNERRRMQSINAGFQALKAMLPRREEEKMSKLQQLFVEQHNARVLLLVVSNARAAKNNSAGTMPNTVKRQLAGKSSRLTALKITKRENASFNIVSPCVCVCV
ncbi:transcription factor AP-4 [Trichinella spiralis]|uniref:transcription factor AP-4 n=1 Tax=Trichinella spiralis TaxID=6334 RepID=UPI0001EFB2CB|nr:transcription factor AP-4 [Trichinella spiralis]